ncbi:transcriptional regulator, XRE family with cupin sensor [Rhizobiales bacterium GAS113]|nr:transcriptional regulator, XRE family with cupin sensor [Rhizobiales bacterium GAS113]
MMIRPASETGERGELAQAKADGRASMLAAAVGKEVRSLRRMLNMPATALAAVAGISNGMLSKIESGTATPSFSTLLALAEALKVPVARLFVGHDERADYSLVRSGKGITIRRRGSKAGITYQLIGHVLSGERYVEPYLVTIDETATDSPGFQHTGIEFMYVLRGSMLYRYAGSLFEIYEGDSLVFDAKAVHGHERILQGPVTYLSVVFNLRA